ncbi:MAG TPA: thioesterase family protein [Myxococcales bacterium]|nr:thioesterase family protein [Myxococcales bacterium]
MHEARVAPGDIDELGHASNLVYLRWLQEAALAHSTSLGFDQAAYLKMGQVWVVRRHEIVYLRPAFEGDELRVETRVTTMGAASSERRTRIVKIADGSALAEAVTDWAFVDIARGRPVRIPEQIRSRFPLEL